MPQPRIRISLIQDAKARQLMTIVFFTFVSYLAIGLPLAVVPGFVHTGLAFGTVVAGMAISSQYLATLLSRSQVGRIADTIGPKQTVIYGLMATSASGLFTILSALCTDRPVLSLSALLIGRLALGVGESFTSTGVMAWGIRFMGSQHTARVISWNGVATYGALSLGAPLGVTMVQYAGLASIGALVLILGLISTMMAMRKPPVQLVPGKQLSFRQVFSRVLPHGIGLALGSTGFGVLATFVTLYYASRHWSHAAVALSLFSLAFVGSRLLFSSSINRMGGFKVAIISLLTESIGLLLLCMAPSPLIAMLGATLTGFGFSLVFPSLGVEAVARVPAASRGAAIGVYSVFLDVALGLTGPLAGMIAIRHGYPAIFLGSTLCCLAGALLVLAMKRRPGASAR
jgi:MFS family permease